MRFSSRKFRGAGLGGLLAFLLLALTLSACGDPTATPLAVKTTTAPLAVVVNSTPPATALPVATPTLVAPSPTTTAEPTATVSIPLITPTPTASDPSIVGASSGSLQPASPTAPEVIGPIPTPGFPTPTPNLDPVVAGLIAEPPVKGTQRWIDVNLSDGTTRLIEGRRVVQELPSAIGYGIPGSPSDFFSTAPGLYWVYSKIDELHHDTEYSGLYFQGWVGFDPSRANGFHSFLLDETGKVVDSRLGTISHGCVRTGDWKAVYDFAEIGMPVVVHGAARF